MAVKKLNLVFRATNHIKLALEAILREIFASDLVPETFRYNNKEKETGVKIYRSFPGRMEFYPAIVIKADAFDGSLMAMGSEGEEASEVFDEETGKILIAQTFTGKTTIPITLKVISKNSTDEREKLSDALYTILRIFMFDKLAPFGFFYNKIQNNGEDQTEYPDREMLFTSSFTIGCHTDYTFVVDIAQNDLINKIIVRVFGQVGNDLKAEKLFEDIVVP